MQSGRIAERGSHAELMAREGEYYDMISRDGTREGEEEQKAREEEEADRREEPNEMDEGEYLWLLLIYLKKFCSLFFFLICLKKCCLLFFSDVLINFVCWVV